MTEHEGRSMWRNIPGSSSVRPYFGDDGEIVLASNDPEHEPEAMPLPSSEVDGLVVPAVCHALNWINDPKDNKQKLVRLAVLQVVTGISNTFTAACSINVDQSTIQRGVKKAREEFGL